MSGDEEKGFLSRWSQRKQEAKQPDPTPDEAVAKVDPPAEVVAESKPEPEFDLSSLPKLEEMTGTTDITGFLRKGVPEQLRNAALRKSWALDPAIRNYVNPALEYAYDWNTPGGVPGSSELGAGMDVARMVSQIMGTLEPAAESASSADPETEGGAAAEATEPEPEPDLPTDAVRLGEEGTSMAQNPGNEAAQPAGTDAGNVATQQRVRRHGSAKPVA